MENLVIPPTPLRAVLPHFAHKCMIDSTPLSDSQSEATASLRQELLDLICRNAFQMGDFVLSSGQKSSYYINCKPVTLDARGALLVGKLLLAELPTQTEAVAGLTLGADPIVTAVSVMSAMESAGNSGVQKLYPALIVRKEAKGHGTQAYIEGPSLAMGSQVVVLEDVVTTGQSAMKAVERLRNHGYAVNHVLALVDRQQGGAQLYEAAGLKFSALFTIPEIQARWMQLQKT
jgi:orotate phosphoribosyltransferase